LGRILLNRQTIIVDRLEYGVDGLLKLIIFFMGTEFELNKISVESFHAVDVLDVVGQGIKGGFDLF
jgi:hypothetical protein